MALLSTEYVLLGALTVTGIISGVVGIRNVTVERLTETANAIGSIDPSYSYPGIKCCGAQTAGSSYQARKHKIQTPQYIQPPQQSAGSFAD